MEERTIAMANIFKKWNENFETLTSVDTWAKRHNRLVGRYITEPIADGKAFYLIVKELKNKVKIKHCKGLGDDYMVPYWGNSATIDKSYAKSNISNRDRLAEIFGY